MGRLDEIRGRIAAALAVGAGVTQEGGLTFTRLGAEGGALHTGGPDGIVYADCQVAGVLAPEAVDPILALLTAAPADLVYVLAELEVQTQAARDAHEERDRVARLLEKVEDIHP